MIKGLIILSFALLITACVSPTTYKSETRSFGYSESKISSNRYEVVFKANNDTKLERINDYVLLRAAEITIKNGYTFFSVETAHYSSEVKKAKVNVRGHYTTPTIYIRNSNDYCEPINLKGDRQSNTLAVNHIKTKQIRHDNFNSRLPDLDDVNSLETRGLEKLQFIATVKKSIIILSNNQSTETKKSVSYRAEEIFKNITTKYQLRL